VAGSVTAMHEFVVTSFSLIDGMGTGKFVSSATFTVAGRDWNIRLYPDGSSTEQKGYVSVFLYFLKGEIGVRVKFTISLCLVDKGDQVSETKTQYNTFDSCVGWGWFKFINKSELQELLQPYKDDSFTIKCVLTVMDKPQTEDVSTGTVIVPESNLHQDLSRMLKNGEGADVTFSVCGQLFPAHKWMLAARSMVFKAEFFGAMKEKDAQCIKIDDVEPAIFEALLRFVYTDSLPDDCGDAESSNNVAMQHLLVAADRYGLDRLRIMCEEKLCRDIDVETVAITLLLAEQHHCAQLKDACLGFIASRNMLGGVMKTDGFKHLITSCPLVMKEILDKVAAAGNEYRG
jgi:speckle-type POZ protein